MTENPYIFLENKMFATTLNHYLTQTKIPCFIVNHFAHIYFIAEILKKTSFIIQNTKKNSPSCYLISPPNAVSYIGVRGWLSFSNRAIQILHQYSITHFLDCFDHAGLAMAALRLGQKHIIFDSTTPQFEILQNRAQIIGALIINNKPDAFNLLNLRFKKNNLF